MRLQGKRLAWSKLWGRSAPEATIPTTHGEITDLERRIRTVESALIVLSIAAIAAADRFVAPSSSLGFLYLIPMGYSALTHRWPVFVLLLAACVWLRQWDTPVEVQSWERLALDWTLVAVFLAVVLPLRRLGRARALFFRAAREQRDELVREVEMAAAVQQHLLDQHRPPRARWTSSPAPTPRRSWAAITTTSSPSTTGASPWWWPTSRARASPPRSSCPR